MTKLIGIVSYLPTELRVREHRKEKLFELLSTCNKLFNLNIYIEAQCWTESEISLTKRYFPNVVINNHSEKLGIVGARRALREYFLNSSYDVLIMLDDDCEIHGKPTDAERYLSQIDSNPNMFYEFTGTLLKLFAISKDIFAKVDYEDVNPEKEEGFEDRVFVNKLRVLFPTCRYTFNKFGLYETSISTKDTYST